MRMSGMYSPSDCSGLSRSARRRTSGNNDNRKREHDSRRELGLRQDAGCTPRINSELATLFCSLGVDFFYLAVIDDGGVCFTFDSVFFFHKVVERRETHIQADYPPRHRTESSYAHLHPSRVPWHS
jgi:hypothetical protein